MQKYWEEWEEGNTWVEKVHNNIYKAHYTVCQQILSIAYGGLIALRLGF